MGVTPLAGPGQRPGGVWGEAPRATSSRRVGQSPTKQEPSFPHSLIPSFPHSPNQSTKQKPTPSTVTKVTRHSSSNEPS